MEFVLFFYDLLFSTWDTLPSGSVYILDMDSKDSTYNVIETVLWERVDILWLLGESLSYN